jgi:hypothetical protein
MTIDKFCEQLNRDLPGTRTSPGIIVSYILDRAKWYAAVHTFAGSQRIVYASAYGENYDQCIHNLYIEYTMKTAETNTSSR